tara:strand:- start:160 stop:354 length:195 start_codon:yes stop_codon:yes gene_type:complete
MDKILFSINNIKKYNSSKRKKKEKKADNPGGFFKRRLKKVKIDKQHKKVTRNSRNTPLLEILYY